MAKRPKHTLKGNVPNNKYWSDYLTVGKLKKYIEENKLPDDALILYQRIEDFYFNKNGWSKNSIKKSDPFWKGHPDEYVVVWSYCRYKDKNLYLTAHY